MKECSTCKQEKLLIEYYTINKTKADGTPYIYYRPDCKECCKKKALEWIKNNPEKFKEAKRKQNAKPKNKKIVNERNKMFREKGYFIKWQRDNKDKIRQYNEYRDMNKKHEISKQEWSICKDYFNDSCAYCGLSASEHYHYFYGELKLQDLHKDHVEHEGSNDITNCVPSCKSCNSSKHTSSLEEWYNINNSNFNEERLYRIYSWLNSDVYHLINYH